MIMEIHKEIFSKRFYDEDGSGYFIQTDKGTALIEQVGFGGKKEIYSTDGDEFIEVVEWDNRKEDYRILGYVPSGHKYRIGGKNNG